MTNYKDFAVVIEHAIEIGGQKKLAIGCNGKWYVWNVWGYSANPIVTSYSGEKAARKAYDGLELVVGSIKYDPTPVPHLISLSDPYWGRAGR